MKKLVRFDREAEEEVDAAVAWYESQRGGLGLDLLDVVDEAVARLVEAPQQVALALSVPPELGARSCPVKRFPYSVIFVELPGEIRVTRIGARAPPAGLLASTDQRRFVSCPPEAFFSVILENVNSRALIALRRRLQRDPLPPRAEIHLTTSGACDLRESTASCSNSA